ncbi:MAG: glycosyltransferase [Cryobacterium sp.]|nr:glycosyltransferase [Cryobacterium sp.]
MPAFVKDQVIALSRRYPDVAFHVLAPHDRRSNTHPFVEHDHYTEHRFHYFWPRRAEKLAGRGIMPALKANPLYLAVIPFLFLGEYAATLRLARELLPSVIYAHWFTPQAVVAARVSRRVGVPFVFTTHASDVDVWNRVPVIGKRLVRSVSARASAITAVSSRSRDKLLRFLTESADRPSIHVIPMGVPTRETSVSVAERASARSSLGLGSGTMYFFIGRLVEKKGLTYLLDALALVGSQLAEWTLVVAGDGPLREDLERQAASLGLASRVTFVGYVTGESKRDYLRSADVMIVPSIVTSDGDAEGLPVALLEGLSYGLCCIATNESGADDIITDGVDGMLCAQRDAVALGERLLDLHRESNKSRAQMSERARSLAQSFSWETIAVRHFDALLAPLMDR